MKIYKNTLKRLKLKFNHGMRVAVKLEAVLQAFLSSLHLKVGHFISHFIVDKISLQKKKKIIFFSRNSVETSRQNGGDSDYPSLAHNTKSLQQQRHCSKPGIDHFSLFVQHILILLFYHSNDRKWEKGIDIPLFETMHARINKIRQRAVITCGCNQAKSMPGAFRVAGGFTSSRRSPPFDVCIS